MANRKEENQSEITLKGYYDGLPASTFPKTDFVNKVSTMCKTSTTTVRNWIRGVAKPKKQSSIDVLVKVTGIPEEKLWNS